MRRIIRIIIFFISVVCLTSSCEGLLEDCKTCKLQEWKDGTLTSEGPGIIYCGEKLKEKENSEPITIGNTTTLWHCE